MTITLFTLPQLLLMKVPIVGPLAVLPMSASAAYLADLLVSKGEAASRGGQPTAAPLQHHAARPAAVRARQDGGVPTLPASVPPPPHPATAGQPSAQGLHARPTSLAHQGSFENASAPPWQGELPPQL